MANVTLLTGRRAAAAGFASETQCPATAFVRFCIVPCHVLYCGFSIPDAFVIGCGLDYAQKYRNLDYIGVLSFEEE